MKKQQELDITADEIKTLALHYPAVFLEMFTELDGAPTLLEPYQIAFLNDKSYFRLVNKSRQIGFSTVIAAEALVKALTRARYRANFVSINQNEAADKIEIARSFYHSIPDELVAAGIKPERPWVDAEHEFAVHAPPMTSNIVSQPASAAIRGGRKDIYFDEFAHIRDAVKLYKAALPATIRGEGRMTIVSTPLGQSGRFYDIATDIEAYPGYSRHTVPWWFSRAMVKPEHYEEALALAHLLDSKSRVFKYGTPKLIQIFNEFGGDLDGFQTEFEATFVDETDAYYIWELIVANVNNEQPIWKDIPPGWDPAGQVTIGVDLAKERDQSVFTVVEHDENGEKWVRYIRALRRETYPEQYKILETLANKVKPSRITIDEGGPGAYFVDEAKKNNLPGVEGIKFSSSSNERWATTFKGDLQKSRIHLLDDPMLKRQIHGIRRTRTESGLYKFSGKSNGGDDYFWSLMLACYGAGRVSPRIRRVG